MGRTPHTWVLVWLAVLVGFGEQSARAADPDLRQCMRPAVTSSGYRVAAASASSSPVRFLAILVHPHPVKVSPAALPRVCPTDSAKTALELDERVAAAGNPVLGTMNEILSGRRPLAVRQRPSLLVERMPRMPVSRLALIRNRYRRSQEEVLDRRMRVFDSRVMRTTAVEYQLELGQSLRAKTFVDLGAVSQVMVRQSLAANELGFGLGLAMGEDFDRLTGIIEASAGGGMAAKVRLATW